MQMYEVEQLGKYVSRVTEVANIEDASNSALTEDELVEAFGGRCYGDRVSISLVRTAIQELQQTAIQAGQVSALCKDDELVNVMKQHMLTSSEFVEHSRRVGNRFFFYTPDQVKAKKPVAKVGDKHFRVILNATMHIINDPLRGSANMHLKYGYDDKVGMLKLCQRLVTINEVAEVCKRNFMQDEADVDLVKQLWNDHSLVEKK